MGKGLFGAGPVAGSRTGGRWPGADGPRVGSVPPWAPVSRPTARMQMLYRPYARRTSSGAGGFYWLVRHYSDPHKQPTVVDRGEGGAARGRIEAYVRRLAAGSGTDRQIAARCWYAGWEARP